MARLKAAGAGLIALTLASGCTSSRPPLGLSALIAPEEPAVARTADASAMEIEAPAATAFETPEGDAAAPMAAVTTGARVQLAPVTGAPAQSVPPLSRGMAARAQQRGIGLVGSGSSATHVMKGYFSAIAEGGETTVIYVWDVLDPAGNRLHRIQGQQKAPGGHGDGWSSVSSATMESIATRTVDELAAWLSRGQG